MVEPQPLTFTLSQEVHAQLAQAATQERRTPAEQAAWYIEEALRIRLRFGLWGGPVAAMSPYRPQDLAMLGAPADGGG